MCSYQRSWKCRTGAVLSRVVFLTNKIVPEHSDIIAQNDFDSQLPSRIAFLKSKSEKVYWTPYGSFITVNAIEIGIYRNEMPCMWNAKTTHLCTIFFLLCLGLNNMLSNGFVLCTTFSFIQPQILNVRTDFGSLLMGARLNHRIVRGL